MFVNNNNLPLNAISDVVVGFEILTVVTIKSTVFWEVTPCSPVFDWLLDRLTL
jgi:hypothetical protein